MLDAALTIILSFFAAAGVIETIRYLTAIFVRKKLNRDVYLVLRDGGECSDYSLRHLCSYCENGSLPFRVKRVIVIGGDGHPEISKNLTFCGADEIGGVISGPEE